MQSGAGVVHSIPGQSFPQLEKMGTDLQTFFDRMGQPCFTFAQVGAQIETVAGSNPVHPTRIIAGQKLNALACFRFGAFLVHSIRFQSRTKHLKPLLKQRLNRRVYTLLRVRCSTIPRIFVSRTVTYAAPSWRDSNAGADAG